MFALGKIQFLAVGNDNVILMRNTEEDGEILDHYEIMLTKDNWNTVKSLVADVDSALQGNNSIKKPISITETIFFIGVRI